MKKTNRIHKLRNDSLNATEHISVERAKLITEFYKSEASRGLSLQVQRARAFEYILKHKEICINPGELIVGERGPKPKATPTYPEINLHTLEDLNILDSRKKVSFKVSQEVKDTYENEIIPFWKGNSNRERIMNAMPNEWIEAYRAGMFTEFQEQRAPGHTVLGAKMFNQGFLKTLDEIEHAKAAVDVLNDPDSYNKLQELEAMQIVSKAILMYAERHADAFMKLAATEKDA